MFCSSNKSPVPDDDELGTCDPFMPVFPLLSKNSSAVNATKNYRRADLTETVFKDDEFKSPWKTFIIVI